MKARLIMFGFLVLAFMAFPVYAQEMANTEMESPESPEDDLMVTYGTVVSVSPQQIVILEYDFDLDADVEMTYVIDENTQLEDIDSLDELQVDDAVEIVYEEKDGVKKAMVIKKEDFALEEMDETDMMEETDMGGEQENMEMPPE